MAESVSYRKDGAGDGVRTRDVQLGNQGVLAKSATYRRICIIHDVLKSAPIHYLHPLVEFWRVFGESVFAPLAVSR